MQAFSYKNGGTDMAKFCTNCGFKLEDADTFCTACGTMQDAQTEILATKICFNCGSKLEPEDVFCTVCGAKQNGQSAAPVYNQKQTYPRQSAGSKKGIGKILLIALGVLLAAAIAFLAVSGSNSLRAVEQKEDLGVFLDNRYQKKGFTADVYQISDNFAARYVDVQTARKTDAGRPVIVFLALDAASSAEQTAFWNMYLLNIGEELRNVANAYSDFAAARNSNEPTDLYVNLQTKYGSFVYAQAADLLYYPEAYGLLHQMSMSFGTAIPAEVEKAEGGKDWLLYNNLGNTKSGIFYNYTESLLTTKPSPTVTISQTGAFNGVTGSTSAKLKKATDVIVLKFDDVPTDAWYYNDVKTSVSLGLISGKTKTTFAPDERVTYAEIVKLAACIHQLYHDGIVTLKKGDPWYQTYVDYCIENGIITKTYKWTNDAKRGDCLEILRKAIPDVALKEINSVPDNYILDVKSDHPQAEAIYRLYRAGILQGVDKRHRCKPSFYIDRKEMATFAIRMLNQNKRKHFSISEAPGSDVPYVSLYSKLLDTSFSAIKSQGGYSSIAPSKLAGLGLDFICGINDTLYVNYGTSEVFGTVNDKIVLYSHYGLSGPLKNYIPEEAQDVTPAIYQPPTDANRLYIWKLDSGYLVAEVLHQANVSLPNLTVYNIVHVSDLGDLYYD